MRIITSFLVFITLSFAIACKKEKAENKTESQIVGKWTLTAYELKEYVDGVYEEDGGGFTEGDYFEFKSNGDFQSRMSSDMYYSTWKVIDGGKKILFDPSEELGLAEEGVLIRDLTPHLLVLYSKRIDGENVYEVTLYLDNL